jgi:hypothetical protein
VGDGHVEPILPRNFQNFGDHPVSLVVLAQEVEAVRQHVQERGCGERIGSSTCDVSHSALTSHGFTYRAVARGSCETCDADAKRSLRRIVIKIRQFDKESGRLRQSEFGRREKESHQRFTEIRRITSVLAGQFEVFEALLLSTRNTRAASSAGISPRAKRMLVRKTRGSLRCQSFSFLMLSKSKLGFGHGKIEDR